jgi:hypothetical protein
MFCNKLAHSSYQTDAKLKHKELFMLCTQRKGGHSNIKSEYFENSGIWMYIYFVFN